MNLKSVFIVLAISLASLSWAAVDNTEPSAPDFTVNGKAVKRTDGFLELGFDILASYKYSIPSTSSPNDHSDPNKIPEDIRKLDGQNAAISGFMLPITEEHRLVKEFLLVKLGHELMRSPVCDSAPIQPNEWVIVKAPKEGTTDTGVTPITVYGQLQVKEIYDKGYLTAIYHLDCSKIIVSRTADDPKR